MNLIIKKNNDIDEKAGKMFPKDRFFFNPKKSSLKEKS